MEGISLETLADYCTPTSLNIARDGSRVVYSLANQKCRAGKHTVSSIWIADVGHRHSTRQLTLGNYNDHSPRFDSSGEHITFLTDRVKAGKAENLYALSLSGGESYPVIELTGTTGIASHIWSPDGSKVAYTYTEEDKDEDQQKSDEGTKADIKVFDVDDKYPCLKVAAVMSEHGRLVATDTITASLQGISVNEICWNPEGTQLAFKWSKTPDFDAKVFHGGNIAIWDVESEHTQKMVEISGEVSDLCWSRELGICFRAATDPENPVIASYALWQIPPSQLNTANDNISAVRLYYGDDHCCGALHSVIGSSDHMVALSCRGTLESIDLITSAKDEPRSLYDDECNLLYTSRAVAVANDTFTIAVVKSDSTRPPQVYSKVISTSTSTASDISSQLVQLSNHHPDMYCPSTIHFIKSTHKDGTPLTGYYEIPSDLESRFTKTPLPCVMTVHGGPYGRFSPGFYDPMPSALLLSKQKYILLQANYRGGMGHGDRYAQTVRHSAAASHIDIIALAEHGIAEGWIDKSKIIINGWSQGGFAAYMAVAHPPESFTFAGAIAGAGVTDWAMMCSTSDLPTYEGLLGGLWPWEADEEQIRNLRDNSPLYLLGKNEEVWGRNGDHKRRTPILMVHGEDDKRVPLSQAVGFYRAMKMKKWYGVDEKGRKKSELVVYPKEGHGGSNGPWTRQHYLDLLSRIEVFVEERVG